MIKKDENNRELWKYAGMGAQFIVAIGIAVFLGMKFDQWLKFSFPLMVWLLPLLFIIGIIVKIIKDTAGK
jgi:hypothetical protein